MLDRTKKDKNNKYEIGKYIQVLDNLQQDVYESQGDVFVLYEVGQGVKQLKSQIE